MRYYPPSYQTINGYLYRLERWHYNNDYTQAYCEYIPDEDLPYLDQTVYRTFPVENQGIM